VGSALVNNERRIVVFNGMPTMASRAAEGYRLMNVAFSAFEAKHVFDKNAKVGEAQVWMGGRKTVPLVATRPVDVAYLRVAKDGLRMSIVYDGPLPAPVKKGDIVAKLVFEGPGVDTQVVPLAAGSSVGKLNPFGRAIIGARKVFAGK
jgi:D-alanyl-D-alanine carboxypeptidase (penicillin-binding protein 5/6)